MAASVDDVRLRLFGIDQAKITDDQIEAAIDEVDSELTYIRKAGVPVDVFDNAHLAGAAYLTAYKFVSATSVTTLGYSRDGQNELLKNLRADADKWRLRVGRKLKYRMSAAITTGSELSL